MVWALHQTVGRGGVVPRLAARTLLQKVMGELQAVGGGAARSVVGCFQLLPPELQGVGAGAAKGCLW
jgi:hypothetical protein